jgi:hypothetical protein
MARQRWIRATFVVAFAVATLPAATPVGARTVSFSGATWTVKTSARKAGPGPNYFSDSDDNVSVDAQGRLHLRITRHQDRWDCAEIIHTASLGYGAYRFYLDSPVDNLDPNVVLGLFTWNDQPAYAHREIDIELSRWSKPDNLNAQYVVQPYTDPKNIVRFSQPAGLAQSTHGFQWQPGSISFQSLRGPNATPPGPQAIIRQWKTTNRIPVPGGENVRFNLWLFRGRGPTDGRDVEVIVKRFEFVPIPDGWAEFAKDTPKGDSPLLAATTQGVVPESGQSPTHSAAAHEAIVKVTPREMTSTPVSPLLCRNFIEEGFGYQVEGMWSEMLWNRSFERTVPLHANSESWYGLKEAPDGDWTKASWYHTGYEHNRWYACPGADGPFRVAKDETFFIPQADGRRVRIEPVAGGVHGTQALKLTNAEPAEWGGVAQDGKYLHKGETYHFRGHIRRLSATPVQAEIRFHATAGGKNDWARPLARLPLGEVGPEDRVYEATFDNAAHEGWASFSLWVSPGAEVMLDAFSLLPQHTIKGWRPDVIAALKRVNPKVIRYPGGCFASFHDWRDAIGPADGRKPEPSYFWGDWNYNDVGTKEFLELCQQVNAEPMLVVDLFHPLKRTSSQKGRPHGFDLPGIADPEAGIKAAADWVAYCNKPAGSHRMADLRAAHGHPEPFRVKYWEMDNEGYRWFSPEEYARTVVRYSRAMKAVDPSINIGLTSYHVYGNALSPMLEIAGEHVDFFADRICDPVNIARKMDLLRQWNKTGRRQLFYADTEALQNRPPALDPYTAWLYKQSQAGLKEAQRCWSYALCLGANLLAYHRCGGDARFMCFNNLANTMSQSCIETPKDRDTILTGPGYVFELMSRTEAAWPLVLEGYAAGQADTIIAQAAWDKDRRKLVLHLLNRGPAAGRVRFDLSALGRVFSQRTTHRLWAESGMTVETVKSRGNVHREDSTVRAETRDGVELELPPFSLIETVLE